MMAGAMFSTVAERMEAILEEQIRNKVNLVGGIEEEIRWLCAELETIGNGQDDAESRGFADEDIKVWLKRLKDTAYEIEDVLDEWEIAIRKLKMEHESNDVFTPPKQKVCLSILSSCFCSKKQVHHHDIANKILNVKQQLDKILMESHIDLSNYLVMSRRNTDPWTETSRVKATTLVDLPAEIYGRDKDRNILVRKLIMPNGGSQEELGLRILSIVGMCGIGKTTLARIIFDDSQVDECFEIKIWIRVSYPFDIAKIAKGIIESVEEGSSLSSNKLDVLLECLRYCISGRRFLLVLDDIRTEDYTKWEPLKESLRYGGADSKILVTTRNEHVAKIMGSRDSEIYCLGLLSDFDCYLIISDIVLYARENVEEPENIWIIRKKLADKCKGLPLTAKVLGILLRFKSNSKEEENVLENEIWQLEETEEMFFPSLHLIFEELSPELKNCFSYCAVFPKGYVIDVERLIEYWMALGYLGSDIDSTNDVKQELGGREYVNILEMLSLFQDFEKSDGDGQIKWFKMYDIVHDFAQYIRMNGRVEATGTKKTTCQVCNPLFVSTVKEYRSLFCHYDEPPSNLCDCLTMLRILSLRGSDFRNMPQEIGNLIHLRWLDLSEIKLSGEDAKTVCKLYKLRFLRLSSCNLKEIPSEIGNLSSLRHLDLSCNYFLRELPESTCDLHELRTLNLDCCYSFSKLPQGIHKLTNLKHLHNNDAQFLFKFPQGLGQLTALRSLTKFHGGSRLNKLGLLKNLNNLSGSLELHIRLTDDLIEDADEAELSAKIHIQDLKMTFYDYMGEKESSLRTEIIDGLKPHPNLRYLEIRDSNGSELPRWIISPLNQLRSIMLSCFNHMLSLPPLGKLPCLEELRIDRMFGLRYVGREFLGTTTEIVSGDEDIGFPKLKKLIFDDCPNWEGWEDITAEEEKYLALRLMPCLTELTLKSCEGLRVLPHRLLRKASSLKVLDISGSTQLQQHYEDEDGSAWKSISQNRRLRIVL